MLSIRPDFRRALAGLTLAALALVRFSLASADVNPAYPVPNTPSGYNPVATGEAGAYTAVAANVGTLSYEFDWGDGTTTSVTPPSSPNTTHSMNHSWAIAGS